MGVAEAIAYKLSGGLFDRKRRLRLTPNYLEYESEYLRPNHLTRVYKEDIADIKHDMEWIYWYRFLVGCEFRVEVKTKAGAVLSIKFVSYFNKNAAYQEAYETIVDRLWEFYLDDIVDSYLDTFSATHTIALGGVRLTG
ncbi:MAG: hypothetical protein LPK07_15540, partial [Hymenobacteraceae bacterium]|nr:hypothetical protein [Hymenobacteraceae bacterium]